MRATLGDFAHLSHFSPAQLGQLEGCAEPRSLPPRTTVFRADQEPTEVFLLERGRVCAFHATSYGDFDLGAVDHGQIFGEQSFVDDLPRSTAVETRTEVDLLALDMTSLRAVGEIDSAFKQALYWAFWKSISEKLRGANRRLLDFFEPGGPAITPSGEVLRMPSEPGKLDMAAKRGVFESQRLSPMEINFLSSLSREERFRAGELIFGQGEPGDKMYIVVDGQVVISTVVPGAGEEALSFVEPGGFFGEMALIDGRPRSADAKAHPEEGALVLSIPKDVVDGLLDAGRVSSMNLLELLCRLLSKRLRQIDEKLVGWFLVAAADPEVRPELLGHT